MVKIGFESFQLEYSSFFKLVFLKRLLLVTLVFTSGSIKKYLITIRSKCKISKVIKRDQNWFNLLYL